MWQVLAACRRSAASSTPTSTWRSSNDLLIGPLFMRAVVWGQPLVDDAAEQTVDVILAV